MITIRYRIEIQEWDGYIEEGAPKIKKIELDTAKKWPDDLDEMAIQRTLNMYAGEDLKLDEFTCWESFARETVGLSWKIGLARYEGPARYFNMAIGSIHDRDPATFYTVYIYTIPKEEAQ